MKWGRFSLREHFVLLLLLSLMTSLLLLGSLAVTLETGYWRYLIIALLACSLIALFYLGQRLFSFLKRARNSLEEMAKGNFRLLIKDKKVDEIGRLAGLLNKNLELLEKFEEARREKIIQEKRKNRLLLENFPVPVMVWNPEAKIGQVNSAFRKELAFNDDLMTQEALMALPVNQEIGRNLKVAREQGKIVHARNLEIMAPVSQRRKFYDATFLPLREPGNGVAGVVVIFYEAAAK